MATEELKVVLRRSSDHSSFGFSLLGTKGPPHVIYEIDENSPAADCGSVEAGDIILKVNDIDVHRYTTKEVLKCLRLSDKSVTLDLRRDPKLKAHIKEQLAKAKSPHYSEPESHIIYDYQSGGGGARSPSNASPRHQAGHPSASDSSPLNNTYTVAAAAASSASPVSRYKSPTHLPSSRQAGGGSGIPASPTAGHSRNSSASSAKIQLGDGGALTSPTGSTASPTCRPSRIPTAMKCPPKSALPQPKRARPSQIPTKASLAAAAAATAPTTSNGTAGTAAPDMGGMHSLQHSYSYSGSTTRYQPEPEAGAAVEHESNSAPVQAPPKAPRFEAYMMTGDLILNLSRTPQSSNLLTGYAKKVDSLRDCSTRAAGPRANGALAPRASGESSPTSSSSVESPTHTASSDSGPRQQKGGRDKGQGPAYRHQQQYRQQQQQPRSQQERDSVNNSYNSGGGGHRKDSLTNDTLLLCEELERDDDEDDEERPDDGRAYARGNNRNAAAGERGGSGRGSQWKHSQKYRYHETSYEYYENEDGGEGVEMVEERDEQYDLELGEENEEDQTHYDITNIETYNSGGCLTAADQSDRQRLVGHCEEGEEDDGGGHLDDEEAEDGSAINSYTSASAKQRLRVLKQRAAGRHKRERGDTTDCARGGGGGGSSSSSATVRSDGVGGANTSQDETSFSVPTSPISLSTPLIEKETANSMPTSPEPSGLGAVGGGGAGHGGAEAGHGVAGGVVRRHNGIVRKCDSAGFRTSKSEDHLQQIQREGIAAVIPIDIDEDVNSSLNTLLDTRQDSDNSQGSSRERIVWTYNAPLSQLQLQQQQQQHQHHYASHYGNNSSPNSNSHSSSISSSPQHSAGSPASPTSVSSSVMSSSGSKGTAGGSSSGGASNGNSNGHHHQQHQQQQQQHQANHQQQQQQQQLHLQQQHQLGGNMNGSGPASSGLLQCPSQGGGGGGNPNGGGGGDLSVSEAISNMSSPDYQDDDNLLSSRDLVGGMTLSDPSDSDSTILVSDAQRQQQQQQQPVAPAKQSSTSSEHKLVIQVRGLDIGSSPRSMHSEGQKDSEDEMATLTEDQSTLVIGSGGPSGDGRDSSPPVSDDGSDVESLHSYHYSPKAVDMPSAIRLAKRLYSLDGFKKSDVSRHLSKNNDFSRAVADEFLKYFTFEAKTLDQSLREFLQQFSLSGETQERERVLVHFSKRFLDCNPGTFNSQDAVHTLTCALMLLNTDLHGQNIGRKMSCADFIDNLSELNDGENFPKDVLKHLYQAIKTQPLEWALDDDVLDAQKQRQDNNMGGIGSGSQVLGQNPFLDMPESSTAVEYKKGYVMRKCCYDTNYKKTPFGKRSWKMFYCTLRDLVLFLHKDEHGFRKSQMSDNVHNAIRIHHALATKANDYTKKQHVFRLQTADQSEYLFQTSDSKELQSWVETINFVCAAYSAPPLEGGVGSQKRFQRPLLPSTHTKYLMKEQLESHEQQLAQLENTLSEHRKGPIPSKGLALQNYKEKESFLQYELRRYKTYVAILNAKMLSDQQQQQQQQTELLQQQQLATNEEETDTFPSTGIVVGRTPQQQIQTNNSIITLEMQQQPQQQQQQPPPQQQQQSTGNRKKGKKK